MAMRYVQWVPFIVIATALILIGAHKGVQKYWWEPHEIRAFLSEYTVANDIQRQAIASKYLNILPASQLLVSLEQTYPLCHVQAHPFGRAVFEKTQNISDAIKICGTYCSDGCFHGALMEMFSTQNDNFGGLVNDEDPQSILTDVESLAQTLCFKSQVASFIALSPCIHGLGHVFTYLSNYDLKGAIGACEKLGTYPRASDCAGGVFMEFMSHYTGDPIVSEQNYYPCDEFPAYAVSCYRYKSSVMLSAWGGEQGALGACGSLDTNDSLACIRGIALAVSTQQKIATPNESDFSNICGSIQDPDDHQACVKGLLDNVLINTDPASLGSACNKMPAEYLGVCLQIADAIRELN